jgi:hypothetical protein
MSKKLIAVVSAAALALSAMAGAAPATATAGPFGLISASTLGHGTEGTTGGDGSGAGASALQINVPSQDVLRYDSAATGGVTRTATGTIIQIAINTTAVASSVQLTAGPGVKLLTKAQGDAPSTLNTGSGVDTLTVVSDSNADAIFFAYSTSTASSTITATQVGTSNTTVIHVRGRTAKTNGYKLNLTATPTTTSPSGTITFKGTVVDMFGNAITNMTSADLVRTGLGGSLTTDTADGFVNNATTGEFTFEMKNRATAGTGAINVALASTALAAEQTRFGARTQSAFFAVNAADLSAVVASLTAQVAALTADYNALVKKWNKRVDSRKAPKKKAALK